MKFLTVLVVIATVSRCLFALLHVSIIGKYATDIVINLFGDTFIYTFFITLYLAIIAVSLWRICPLFSLPAKPCAICRRLITCAREIVTGNSATPNQVDLVAFIIKHVFQI